MGCMLYLGRNGRASQSYFVWTTFGRHRYTNTEITVVNGQKTDYTAENTITRNILEWCHCMKVLRTQDLENLILQLRRIRRVPRGLGRLFLADNVLPVFRLLGTPPPTRFRWPGDIIGLFAYSSSIVPVMGACLGPSSLEARSSHPNKPDVRPELTLMPALGTGDLSTDTGTQRSQDAAGWASRTYCSVTGGLF